MAEVDVEGLWGLLVEYGYLIVAIAAFAEAMPLLGWFVPGQAIIIVAGAVAATGQLSIWTLILIAIPAGIIGDAVGYYLGRYYGRAFLEKHGARLRITEKHLSKSDSLFRKYGPFALIIARFNFLTRAVGPILAGMAKMRARVFWPINLVGALAWSVAYAALGYAFGVSFLQLQGVVGKILAWTVLGVVALTLFYRVLRKYADQFTRDDLYLALLGAAAGSVFGIVADRVQKAGPGNVLDANAPAIAALFAPVAPFFAAVELLTSFQVLGALSLAALLYFFVRRRWWDATLVGLGMGGIIVLVESLRPVFRNALPPDPGASFPSASAAVPLVLAGVGTYLVASSAKRLRTPLLTALVAGALATLALLARLAQVDESPSSVLAGLALGVAWLCVSLLIVEFRLKRTPRRAGEEE